MTSHEQTSQFYAGGGLDRAHDRRGDPAWVEGALRSRDARILPIWRNRNLIQETGPDTAEALTITGDHARGLLQIAGDVALLGLDGETPYFAADVSEHDEPTLTPIIRTGAFADIRAVAAMLDARDAALMAHARGLMYWHRRHQYCGVCGAKTASLDGGARRMCTAGDCGIEHHPRTDPAVIMLLTRPGPEGGAALLARKREWPDGMYAVLAGFVEPGESLEEAVAREAFEETGLTVGDIAYNGSQPWPFPSNVMIAFTATAKTVRIEIDPHELEDARWFTRDQIRAFPEKGFKLPRTDSIAHALIRDWLDGA
jgi:NAD+ diphosphatase